MSKTTGPGSALFGRLRLTLALWYSALLVIGYLVTGTTLYAVLREQLLGALRQRMIAHSEFHGGNWIEGRQGACSPLLAPGQRPGGPGALGGSDGQGAPGLGNGPPPRPESEAPFYIVCFDASGTRVHASREPRNQQVPAAPLPDALVSESLVPLARRDGSAWDVVDGGPDIGVVLRAARSIKNDTGEVAAVVIAAESAERELNTLQLVLHLLLGLGAVSLLLAGGGGWIMANRALAPTRLAFARQQAFISDASHELRTPLTLLRANAELLLRRRDRLDSDDAEILDDIVAETDNMSRLASDLLTLARLDAGRLELEREVVDLSTLGEVLARRVAGLAQEKQIVVQPPAGQTGDVVFADAQYVEQAGLILVENAVKYTPPGGTVTLSTERSNGHASLVVQDTGLGIPKEHLSRLGERFYRGDASRNRATGGTGLGLAIAFRIARAHGGSIQIESEPGAGTRATLSLPAAAV